MKILKLVIVFIIVAYSGLAKAQESALILGLYPYVSPSTLIKHHKNIPIHFTKSAEIDLSLVTAKDVTTYIDNLQAFEYDLIYSPPHLARFVEKTYGYRRVAMTLHEIRGLLIVLQDSPFHSTTDLTDQTISIVPEKALLHQMTLKLLKEQGLIPGQNIQLKVVNSHNNAIYSLFKKDSEAAVTGIKILKNMASREKAQLRILAKTEPVSGFIVMAKPTIKQATIDQLQAAFLAFNSSLLGVDYIFNGFKLIDDESMRVLEPYTEIFK